MPSGSNTSNIALTLTWNNKDPSLMGNMVRRDAVMIGAVLLIASSKFITPRYKLNACLLGTGNFFISWLLCSQCLQ